MAEEKKNLLKEFAKYKFGLKDVDLNKYIHNIGTNVLSYMDSKKDWNDSQKLEFMNSYNLYLSGLKDLLNNKTNRFSTDDFGTIVDATGQLSNDDSDTGYYNDKNEKITAEEYEQLRKRKQKAYKTFQSNREVASYFNEIGKAMSEMPEEKKEEPSNKFDLAKHGYISYWQRKNNPAGGKMNLTPWLDMDKFDETTGKRSRDNRSKYLALDILEYLNQLKDYDFEGSSFGSADAYRKSLQEAASRLADGTWDNNDLIALNLAGIGGDFQTAFFSEEENPNLTTEQKANIVAKAEAEEKAKQTEELKKAYMDWINKQLEIYDNNNYEWNDKNPYMLGTLDEKYFNDDGSFNGNYYRKGFTLDPNKDNSHYFRDYFNNYLSNPFNSEGLRAIAGMIGMGYAKKLANGQYYIPQSARDRQTNSALVYDPNTGQLKYNFIGDIKSEWDLMNRNYKEANGLANRADRYAQFNKEGGTIEKMQLGGGFDPDAWMAKDREKSLEKEGKANTLNTSYQSGRTAKQQSAGERLMFADPTALNPNNKFSGTDIVRLGTIAADIVSMGAAFAPGVGTAVSAATGVGSSVGTFFADAFEDGLDWGDFKNLGANLGMDFLGMIPGGGAASKSMKIAKNLGKYATRIIALIGAGHTIANGDKIIASYSKLLESPSELNVDDWRNISAGLGLVTGGVAAGSRKYLKAKQEAKFAKPDNVAVEFVDANGNKSLIGFTGEDAKSIRNANGNIEAIRNVTTNKYEKLRNLDISTNSDFGLRSLRLDGHWQSPLGPKEGGARVFDVGSDNKGLYAKTKTFLDDLRFKDVYTDLGANKELLISDVDAQVLANKLALIDPMVKGSKNIEQGLANSKKYLTELEKTIAENDAKLNKRTSSDLLARKKSILDEEAWLTSNDIKNKYKLYLDLSNDINGFEMDIKNLEAKMKADPGNPDLPNLVKDRDLLITLRDDSINKLEDFKKTNPEFNTWESRITNNELAIKDMPNLDLEILDVIELEKTLADNKVKVDKLKKRITDVESGNVHSKAYNDFKAKYVTGDDVIFKSPSAYRDDVTESFKEILKKNGILYKKGGNLNISNVRKFLKAGKITNTSSTANWYRDMFSSDAMKNWLSTFNLDNYQDFNNLLKSWKTNLDATKYTPGINPVEYNLGVYDRQGLWNATNTNSVISDLLGKGVITTRGNSGDNKGGNYQDGYFGELEYLRHGGSLNSWAGHENELKQFLTELAKRKLQYTLDPNTGMYMMSPIVEQPAKAPVAAQPANTQSSPVELPNAQASNTTVITEPQVEENSEKSTYTFNRGRINPTLTYGLTRLGLGLRTNNSMRSDFTPFHQDPYAKLFAVRGDLDAIQESKLKAAALRSLASKPLTASGAQQEGVRSQGELGALDIETQGKRLDNAVTRQNEEKSWEINNENNKNAHDVAQQNKLADLLAQYNINKEELVRKAKTHEMTNTILSQLEFEAKLKLAENKSLEDKFAYNDIHNAVYNNLRKYVSDLTPDEENIWNQVVTGASKPSDFVGDPIKYNAYVSAFRKASKAEQDQLRQYKGIPENDWSNVKAMALKKMWKPVLAKDGSKLEVANVKAKTEAAKIFQKTIKESLDRNEKALDRISKSLYGYIKASIIK